MKGKNVGLCQCISHTSFLPKLQQNIVHFVQLFRPAISRSYPFKRTLRRWRWNKSTSTFSTFRRYKMSTTKLTFERRSEKKLPDFQIFCSRHRHYINRPKIQVKYCWDLNNGWSEYWVIWILDFFKSAIQVTIWIPDLNSPVFRSPFI